jgi:hypothetical protein
MADPLANIVDLLWWSDALVYMETNSGESVLRTYAVSYGQYTITYRPADGDTVSYSYLGTTNTRTGSNASGTLHPVLYSSNGQSLYEWILIRKHSPGTVSTTVGSEVAI